MGGGETQAPPVPPPIYCFLWYFSINFEKSKFQKKGKKTKTIPLKYVTKNTKKYQRIANGAVLGYGHRPWVGRDLKSRRFPPNFVIFWYFSIIFDA